MDKDIFFRTIRLKKKEKLDNILAYKKTILITTILDKKKQKGGKNE